MKCITFTSASGTPGVIWPAPELQLAGESDEDFAARIRDIALPAGATGAQIIDAAAYVPPAVPAPPPPPIDARLWLERLPLAKQTAIIAAAIANPPLLLWVIKAAGAQAGIVLADPDTAAGVGALVAAGILTSADQAILMAP
jgi:hypothetical protein